MQTAAEARAACIAQGTPASECDDMIKRDMVNGVFCDGTIVIDASGRRCVPQAIVNQKTALQLQNLPPQPMSITTKRALAIGGLIAAIGLAYYLTR